MSKGQCLCGEVSWEFFEKPRFSCHCHCRMCRKAHGAAYGSYYFVTGERFCWISRPADITADYQSSPTLTRSFCRICGSVVPHEDDTRRFMYVPAGSHDDGPEISRHIFVASKAPWLDITGDLPQHDGYPPGVPGSAYDNPPLSEPTAGIARGSCLCGEVRFEVTLPFSVVHNCYCSRCRKQRAAAFTTNGFTTRDAVAFTQGSDCLDVYKMPSATYFTHVFCKKCGSGLPRLDSARNLAITPLGALDDDPGCKADDNIFILDKARWSEVSRNLPSYDRYPPRA